MDSFEDKLPPVLIVPDPLHPYPASWLTRLASQLPQVCWVRYGESSALRLPELAEAVEQGADRATSAPLVLAHGEGCHVAAHWATRTRHRVLAALMTGLPEAGCLPVPQHTLPFPTLVASSEEDSLVAQASAADAARHWGATVVGMEAFGKLEWGLGPASQARHAMLWLDTLAILAESRVLDVIRTRHLQDLLCG